ncbi:MAG: hypothetical protein GY771_01805 [bacterium]|nr:hypothetical protein [bacterium]
MIHVDFKMFFDTPGVMAKLDQKRRTVLIRTGAATWKAMRRSMRPAKKKKNRKRGDGEGKPPRYRQGDLRREISFGYDDKSQSVVTGPRRLPGSKVVTPELLNEGGTAKITLPALVEDGVWKGPGKEVVADYGPRPYATADAPAFAEGEKVFLELTENLSL